MIELPAEHRRAIRTAIWKSEFRSIAAFGRAIGMSGDHIAAMLRGPAPYSHAYLGAVLDRCREFLGVDVPTPAPMENDILARLVKLGRIRQPEAAAGQALRTIAEEWEFPGLEPSADLLRAWPPALRHFWRALRAADVETMAYRPPLPTCTSTVWSVCVIGEPPAIMTPYPKGLMPRLEIVSLRIGLKALVTALTAEIPVDDATPTPPALDFDEEDRRNASEKAAKVTTAISAVVNEAVSARLGAEMSGLSTSNLKTLKRIAKARPDLLAEINAGRLSIYAAGVEAGVLKSSATSDGTARIGAPPKWPPTSETSWKIFRAIQARDPELATRVERQELSVTAAGLACGYLKPAKPRNAAA
ncbi:hypothetical protein VPG91_06175 [Nitrospirillum amazonense]|uniref:hypothetical protein n=1 Tax=Nitrospirillum amazonense TaxID=28077 RepID=UPI002DD4212D|nr:hypothetical protein [Nitrospirillum amazonense]MEC4590566.1 hypothetical protein [Nitrospirillum amazonense]